MYIKTIPQKNRLIFTFLRSSKYCEMVVTVNAFFAGQGCNFPGSRSSNLPQFSQMEFFPWCVLPLTKNSFHQILPEIHWKLLENVFKCADSGILTKQLCRSIYRGFTKHIYINKRESVRVWECVHNWIVELTGLCVLCCKANYRS